MTPRMQDQKNLSRVDERSPCAPLSHSVPRFGAVFAMSAVAVSAAGAAALPEFKPVPAKKKFTDAGGKVIFKWGANEFTCAKSTATGEITGAKTVGKLVTKLTECKTAGATKEGCPINSVGAKEGEIVMKSLDGELGTVKTTGASSGVGLLLKPEVEKKWATLEANGCTRRPLRSTA